MTVPRKFRKQPPSFSFDWIDYVSGCGYRKFYCACDQGGNYFLIPRVMNSSAGSTAGTIYRYTSAPGTLNFDITVKKATRVGGGDAFVTYPCEIDAVATTITISLVHYDGTTETTIGSTALTETAAANNTETRFTFVIAVTETAFRPGDILRLKFVRSAGTGFILYHDPAADQSIGLYSSGGATTGTDMWAEVPFQLEI